MDHSEGSDFEMLRISDWIRLRIQNEIVLHDYTPISGKIIESAFGRVKSGIVHHFEITDVEKKKLEDYSAISGLSYGTLCAIRNIVVSQMYLRNTQNIDREKVVESFCLFAKMEPFHSGFYQSFPVSPCTIYKIISKTPTFKTLSEHQMKQISQPVETLKQHEKVSSSHAQQFENILEKALDALDLAFETEDDLKKKGERLTPDILFPEPVWFVVSNHEVQIRWIDAKNMMFFGKRAGFMCKKMTQQANKYVASFGPGAFVFSNGLLAIIRSQEFPFSRDYPSVSNKIGLIAYS